MRREYARPTPYHQAANDNLDGVRRRLAEAEATAGRARDWTTKARAEQDVKQLRQQIAGAGVHRRATRSAVAGNRYAPTVPYFATEPRVAANADPGFQQLARAVEHARRAGLFLKG